MMGNDENLNDDFGKWIKETLPEPPEPLVRQEAHLAVLKERFRAKKSKRRHVVKGSGLVAAALLVIALFGGNIPELGGENFELKEINSPDVPGRVFTVGSGHSGFNMTDDLSEEEIQEFSFQNAANEGVVVGMEGYVANEVELWSLIREYSVGGVSMVTTRFAKPDPSHEDILTIQSLDIDWVALSGQALSGARPPDKTVFIQLEGIEFEARRWSFTTEKYGTVYYFDGVPLVKPSQAPAPSDLNGSSFDSLKPLFR